MYFQPGRGDREIWWNPTTGKKFEVDSDIESRHTANEVLKQAGLDKAFQSPSTETQPEAGTSTEPVYSLCAGC